MKITAAKLPSNQVGRNAIREAKGQLFGTTPLTFEQSDHPQLVFDLTATEGYRCLNSSLFYDTTKVRGKDGEEYIKTIGYPFPEAYVKHALMRVLAPERLEVFSDDILFIDTETLSAEHFWNRTPEEFFRLGQFAWGEGDVILTQNLEEFRAEVRRARLVVGHNIHNYDLSYLFGDDAMGIPTFDTMTHANLVTPAPYRFLHHSGKLLLSDSPEKARRFYALDNMAWTLGLDGKLGDLRDMARRHHCDIGEIPMDQEYLDYAKQDIVVCRELARAHWAMGDGSGPSAYEWREQELAAINAQISRNGFRVDTEVAQARVEELTANKEATLRSLQMQYGFPTEGKMPWRTKAGKEAIISILASHGISESELPKTATGNPSLGGEALLSVTRGTDAESLGESLATLLGQRSLAQLALDSTQDDGLCHPDISAFQRSGRYSVTRPGLTVWNSRGDGAVEKSYFLPNPDEVLIEFDYSNADQRIVAACSQDPAYMKLFNENGDLHELAGRLVWGDEEYESNAPFYRQQAKACIPGDQLVLTDTGLVRMDKVEPSMLVWDGEEWVQHDGLVYQGTRRVIEYEGLRATPDHRVYAWSEKGAPVEISLGDAAAQSLALVQTGAGGLPVRVGRDHQSQQVGCQAPVCRSALYVLRRQWVAIARKLVARTISGLRTLLPRVSVPLSNVATAPSVRCSAALHESQETRVPQLWGAGGPVQLRDCQRGRSVGLGQSGGFRSVFGFGSHRYGRSLRAGESSVGDPITEPRKQALYGTLRVRPLTLALHSLCRYAASLARLNPGRNHSACSGFRSASVQELAGHSSSVAVYDLLNAGPRSRFTVSGVLVHNCNHAFAYGCGVAKLSETAGVSIEVAERFIEARKQAFPLISRWQDEVRYEGENGYVTNWWGRKMPVEVDRVYTQSPALIGQSGTREILSDALIRLRDLNLLRFVKISVHDAIVFSVPKSDSEALAAVFETSMSTTWRGVEFPVDHGPFAENWFAAGH